jgi:hypothetical protein
VEGALPDHAIEEYVGWRRADGELLDPWMRVHERLGAPGRGAAARVVADHRHSRRVGVVDGLTTRERGLRLPRRLAPVHIDIDADLGGYWEPNVWMIHPRL